MGKDFTKRNHHYVPKSLLAGFTKKQNVDSPLWVFDTENGKQWESKPVRVAVEKDLYSVDLPDTKPDVFEDAFEYVENITTPIIKNICNNLEMPTGDDYNFLMNYIALLAVRTPYKKETMAKPMEDISKILLQMITSTPERFESQKQKMGLNEENSTEKVPYDKLRRFVFEGNFKVSFDNNTHVKNLITALDAILEPLAHRRWSIIECPPTVGDFICSDNLVSLHWTEHKDRGFFSSPGHGLLGTEVSIPLSSRVMLLGRFEEFHPPLGIVPSKRTLAMLNSNTGRHARFIYSRKNDFIWYTRNDRIGNVEDFKELIKEENIKSSGG